MLRAAFFDRNSLTGSLDGLCDLPTFQEYTLDLDGAEILSSDCGSHNDSDVVEVSCSCCSICCHDLNTDLCNNNTVVSSLDGVREAAYHRLYFKLGNDTFFFDRQIVGGGR
jgi:hypothetical protein